MYGQIRLHRSCSSPAVCGAGDAHAICSMGPVLDGDSLAVTREYLLNGVVGYFRKAGKEHVHFLEFERLTEEDGCGITGHPGIRTHESMAAGPAAEIRNIKHW